MENMNVPSFLRVILPPEPYLDDRIELFIFCDTVIIKDIKKILEDELPTWIHCYREDHAGMIMEHEFRNIIQDLLLYHEIKYGWQIVDQYADVVY